MQLKFIGLFFLAFVVVGTAGCGESAYNNPVLTPQDGDPLYPCHDENGRPSARMVSCRPVDGTHTCCNEYNTCVPGGCAYQGNPYTLGASRVTARIPESP